MEETKVKITKDENPTIPDGRHLLTGVDVFMLQTDWQDIDGWVVLLDGTMYIAYYDPTDGYRSYAGIREASEEEKSNIDVINKFAPQEVFSKTYRETVEDDGWCQRDAEVFVLENGCGETVFEVSTDFSEDYHPRGYVSYKPQNLPGNLSRAER